MTKGISPSENLYAFNLLAQLLNYPKTTLNVDTTEP